MSLCIPLLAGWDLGTTGPESGDGKLRLSPEWRLLWAEGIGSGRLSPRQPLHSLWPPALCREVGRGEQWAAYWVGDPLGNG